MRLLQNVHVCFVVCIKKMDDKYSNGNSTSNLTVHTHARREGIEHKILTIQTQRQASLTHLNSRVVISPETYRIA